MKNKKTPLSLSLGLALLGTALPMVSAMTTPADETLFQFKEVNTSHLIACGGKKEGEHKCGSGSCGSKPKDGERKCGSGSCGSKPKEGEHKCGSGSCGSKPTDAKPKDGEHKCGSGSCGAKAPQ